MRRKPKEPIKRAGVRLVGMPPDAPEDTPVSTTAPTASAASSAATRAKNWRDEQKKKNADFAKEEAKRKKLEREEAERKRLLEEALESGLFPVNLNSLRKKDGEKLWLGDAPQGKGKLVTGGYDSTQLGKVDAAHRGAEGGNGTFSVPAKRKKPVGHGPDSTKPQVPSGYAYFPPKDVLVMRRFVQNCMDEKPMLIWLFCQEQVAAYFSFEAAYRHLDEKHPERFAMMMERVRLAQEKKAKGCTEDHLGMVERKGGGNQKIYCARCKRLIYTPLKLPKSP